MTNFQKLLTKVVNEDPMDQEGVAEKLHITASYISMLKSGKRKLSKGLAEEFGKIYGYDPEELIRVQKLESLGLIEIENDENADVEIENQKVKTIKVKESAERSISNLPLGEQMQILFNEIKGLKAEMEQLKSENLDKTNKLLQYIDDKFEPINSYMKITTPKQKEANK